MAAIDPELDALGRWIKAAANLSSIPLKIAPAAVARPVILWEAADRRVDRRLNAYERIEKVKQFGKLYVNDVFQAAELERKLLDDLEEVKLGVLPIYESATAGAERIGWMKQVSISFSTTDSTDLNVPVTVEYEVCMGRARPAQAPHASYVGNRLTTQGRV